MNRTTMDFSNLWLPLIGGGIFIAIAISAWFADKKVTAIWFGFAGGICLLLLLALQIQQYVVEADAPESLSREAAAERIVAIAQARAQRAWLSARPQLIGKIEIGMPVDIELVIENVGKEPATGVNHHGVTMMFDMPAQIGYAPEIWSSQFVQVIRLESDLAVPTKGRMSIFPGQKPTLQVRWDNPKDIEALIAATKILVIYGCLGYFTGDEPHFTWYCFFLMRDKRGGWSLGSAPIGNDAT